MTGWIIAAVYIAGWVITARKASLHMLNEDHVDDAEDRAMSRALGVLLGLVWPLILIGALVTGRLPKTDRQLRAEHTAQQKRITELERELGIGTGLGRPADEFAEGGKA